MKPSDNRKRSVYFEQKFMEDVAAHALRLERSFSWVIHYGWVHGKVAVERLKGPEENVKAKIDARLD